MTKFAERLKELRIDNHLSQQQLAKELNVSQAAIARWEAKLQIPNIDILMVVALYFKVSAGYLLGLEN